MADIIEFKEEQMKRTFGQAVTINGELYIKLEKDGTLVPFEKWFPLFVAAMGGGLGSKLSADGMKLLMQGLATEHDE